MTQLPDLGDLLRLRQTITIVHRLPGRIRLRIRPDALAWAGAQGLDLDQALGWLQRIQGVTGIRLNPAAASLVVEYDPEQLDPTLWDSLITGDDDQALALAFGLLATA